MKLLFLLAFSAGLAAPQSSTTMYGKDVNGNRTQGRSFDTAANGDVTERFQSINGRQVPVEQITERVLSQDASSKVTERTIRKFDLTGQPALTERVVVEESKQPGGATTIRETTYRNDTNGTFRETERKTTETRVSGTTTTSSTSVDRPSVGGSFETVEKRSSVSEGPADNQHTTESVYSRDVSGGFRESVRLVKTASKQNGTTKESAAIYEPGLNGQLQLDSQSESVSAKQADGTERIETSIFAKTVAGNIQDSGGGLRVKEQQVVQRRANPDGSVVETVSVRRPGVSDPNRLGDLQKVSETVCRGKCQPEANTPADATKADPAKPQAGSSRP